MIEVKVRKKLGGFLLDAEICDQGFICVAGKNGSGKTSLLYSMAGIYAPDEGYVRVNSEDVTSLPTENREVVLVTPESCIPNFDVERHLVWGARVRGVEPNFDAVNEVKQKLGISYSGRVGKLSLGMRERVSLATAILSRPRVILIDEAFSNLDNKEEFTQEYRQLCQTSHVDAVFTTQDENGPKGVDHLYRMENGRSLRVV